MFLERKGFKSIPVPNVLEATRTLKRGGIDLVLTDYQMPEMTGLDLIHEVHKAKLDIPVVLMSGSAEMRLAVDAIQAQAFDFLQKPVDSADLLSTIELALTRREPEKANSSSGIGVGPVYCVRSEHNPAVTVLELNRPLDEFSQRPFESAIRRLLADGEIQNFVILGLRNVTYINNVGLNFLLSTYKDLKASGRKVVLTQISDTVYKYLKVLGYLDYFPNTLTMQDALAFFQSH